MPKTANKVSFLIESQLPDFINEEYELFSKFIQKYYEQLEIQGQPLDIVSNIQTYADIDYYEKNVLNQSTTINGFIQSTDSTITVVDTSSFPDGGYIKINDEICFYAKKTDTQFLEVSRGVSGNTTLGDLYEKSAFVTTQAADHVSGSTVQNISNLFLYSLVKSFEKQYLTDFPEAYLKEGIDKRTLIKNIGSFYQSKGTDSSIKFLFNCLIDTDVEPSISYPRDHTLKASESNWVQSYALKAKILSGNVNDLVGKTISQTDGDYASAIVDNVRYAGKFDGEDLYEIILNEASVNGQFSIAARTKLTKEVDANTGVGDRIDVFSTMAWKKTGKFNLDDEVITYENKNVNQFVIKSRTGTGAHPVGTSITYGANVSGANVDLLIFGVLYNLDNEVEAPYSNAGDKVEVSEAGFSTTDVRIVDAQNNLRWITSTGTAAIADLNPNVSAIFEDGEGYYIASSGFPSHAIGTLPADAQDQKHLKIIRKHPISVTESYETQYRDVGVAINGIPFMGYKDEEVVLKGAIQNITVNTKGDGYKKPPYVLINNTSSLARTRLAGEVVESVIVDTAGDYSSIPTVDIVSGRNGTATAVVTSGEITSIVVDNAGEYYSSAPEVRITDKVGKGRFADYVAEVSNDGQITGFVKVTGGNLYSQENVVVEIIAVGHGATATASIKEWRKDRYYNNQSNLDADNGYWLDSFNPSLGQGYAYYASPTTLRANDSGVSHSSIIGFAYDGNPIYGAYGYTNPIDSSTPITRMMSSYSKNTSRVGGPSTTTYPIGTFINDWTYVDESGSLDANNGRYCVTPEFPEGTYAYFITVNPSGSPVFPYILGNNYYSLPVDSNYNSLLSQDDIPVNSNRLRVSGIDSNGDLSVALIDDVKRGDISSVSILNSGSNFSVTGKVVIDDTDTEGYGAAAEIESVKGKSVTSVNALTSIYIELSNVAYLFDGDTITQATTGATGTIVGNVVSSKIFALSSVTGTFDSTNVLSSNTKVLSLILDKNASYTKGAILSLGDGISAATAKGEVLESTTSQNTVKIKVTDTGFIVSDSLFLTSSDLIDTTGAKIVSIGSLSDNLSIFNLEDKVALLTTSHAHGVAVNETIDINIDPDDSTTDTTYYVRKRIYQDVVLKNPVISTSLSDTGVARVAILNGGNDYTQGTYNDLSLIGGSGSGAEANILVSSAGHITSVEITNKGTGYKKFDELTIGDGAAGETDTSTPSLVLSVDHVGFSIQNAVLNVANGGDIQKGDLLLVNDEILLVDSTSTNAITVQRAQNNTTRSDHFDGTVVSVYDAGYNLTTGHVVNDGTIVSYDATTQKASIAWGYTETLSSIEEVSLSTVFFDEVDSEGNKRLVQVSSISSPDIYYEISSDNTNFTRNPVINVNKYYKYTFNTTHSSMIGCGFDFSPSINFNLITPEVNRSITDVNIKLGYGARISSNNYSKRKESNYLQYFYYDRDGIVNSEKSYLNVTSDPLQGNKTAMYVTPNKIVYSTTTKSPYNGSGVIKYTSKSLFSVGEIDSIKVTNIGIDYKKLPIVTGIIDADGNVDTNVDCYLNSKNIGIPRNIRIINNGGSYHNDKTLNSSFTSNYILTLSGFDLDAFSIGETIVQKSGSVEIARAKVTSWRKGSNILLVNKISGIFREKQQIVGLSRKRTATIESINYNQFSSDIKTYYDNLGYYKSDSGKVSDANQRITDSFYYQDYSYLVKSETPINTWRSLIKETTHPAGFKLFGEVVINSLVDAKMSETSDTSRVSVIQLWDPEKNNVTVVSTRRQITQSIALMKNLNVEKGVGSVSIDTKSTAEIKGNPVFINGIFEGSLSEKGNLSGNTDFGLIDSNGNAVKPYNAQTLVVTLDGILQEPGVAYNIVDEDKIEFAQPPLKDVTFHARWFQFKDDSLNAKYFKKIKNIFQKNGRWLDAANQIEMNKQFIQSESLGYIKNKYPEFSWNTKETDWYIDIGLVVDGISHDVRFGGNQKTLSNAERYFTGGVLSSLTGDAILTDAATGDKTSELEAAVEAYEYAVGLAKLSINNALPSGTYTTISPYSNGNITIDSETPRCADVLSAIETLGGVLKTTLNSGVGTIDVSYADYFDGENTIFELYYEDGTSVDTQVNEDLFIALSGVLQHTPAYTIDRTSVPNKVVFDTPPLWGQESNTKTLQEGLAVEKFFAHGVGNYIRCGINNTGISKQGSTGPFLILDPSNEIKILSNPEFALVFIDGVLQRETYSYTISGPAIRFTKNIFAGSNVEIILVYGRDINPSITLYDFEKNQYYNEIVLTCDAGSANNFTGWKRWYGDSSDFFQVAYQKIGGKKIFIGNVKSYRTTSDELIITIAGGNPNTDNSNIFFAGMTDFSDEYELTGTTNTISIVRDDSSDYRMQRNTAKWLYGSKRADEVFYERRRGLSNLNAGDIIKIDGEDSYRTIDQLPQYVSPKTYNAGDDTSISFFGNVETSSYAGDVDGVGLSVTCEVTNGSVSSITWNKTDLQLLYDTGVLKPSGAKDYHTTPILHFIPVDQQGGGARAEVKVSDGQIVDIVLTNAGSGYTKAPSVVTARQYDVIKQRGRKIDSSFTLLINTSLIQPSPAAISAEWAYERRVEVGTPAHNINLEISTPVLCKEKITLIIQKQLDLSPLPISQEYVTYYATSIASASVPTTALTSQGTSIIELDHKVQCRLPVIEVDIYGNRFVDPGGPPGEIPGAGGGGGGGGQERIFYYNFGFVDKRRISYKLSYNQGTLGPRFLQWEGAKFMSTGDIVSPGGFSVSAYTIQEWEGFNLQLQEFENNSNTMVADNDYLFNVGYPSINNYLTVLDTADLPDANGAGYNATGEVIYTTTQYSVTENPGTPQEQTAIRHIYPEAGGKILIGRETISYTSKMSDRLLGCTRGVDGSPIEEHTIGTHIRNAL